MIKKVKKQAWPQDGREVFKMDFSIPGCFTIWK